MRADALCRHFGLNTQTGSARSSATLHLLRIHQMDPRWSLPNYAPLSSIAKKIGSPARCLRYWFPELCRELSARYRAAEKTTSLEYQANQAARVREVVQQLKNEGVYPSRRRVNGILRKEGMSLAQAHLLKAYRDAL